MYIRLWIHRVFMLVVVKLDYKLKMHTYVYICAYKEKYIHTLRQYIKLKAFAQFGRVFFVAVLGTNIDCFKQYSLCNRTVVLVSQMICKLT